MEKRAIAFDIGNKRIGVAVSDPFGSYAMPCETYHRTKSFWTDVEAVAKIAKERGAGVIVCGMPVNFDGSESIQTVKTREFVDALREKTDLPIVLEDERFTTMQAREVQIQGGVRREDRKKSIDSIAASYILDGYLAREAKRRKAEAEELERQKLAYKIVSKRRDIMKDEILSEGLTDEEYEELNLIELEDADGNTEKYLHIATIPYKGHLPNRGRRGERAIVPRRRRRAFGRSVCGILRAVRAAGIRRRRKTVGRLIARFGWAGMR